MWRISKFCGELRDKVKYKDSNEMLEKWGSLNYGNGYEEYMYRYFFAEEFCKLRDEFTNGRKSEIEWMYAWKLPDMN